MAAPFLDGVDGGGGRVDETEGNRGRLTAIVSPVFSVDAGRFFAWLTAGASVLSERSLRFGGKANMRFNVCRILLDIRNVTINRLFSRGSESSSSSSSSCSTGAFLAVVVLYRSSLLLSLGSSFSRSSLAETFLRDSSASKALGNVGDRSAGNRTGDLSLTESFFVLGGGGKPSDFLSFVDFVVSPTSSRTLLLSPLSAEFWLSKFKCRGERSGGTDDREVLSTLADVVFVLPDAPGRAPLTESLRARPAGEGLRAAEALVPLRILRPFERDDELVGLSLDGMSEGAKDSLSFRRGGSSRLGRERSSTGRDMSGRDLFCER